MKNCFKRELFIAKNKQCLFKKVKTKCKKCIIFFMNNRENVIIKTKNEKIIFFKIFIDILYINVLLYVLLISNADVAELADALVLGTSVNDVGVQVPSSAPNIKNRSSNILFRTSILVYKNEI